MQKYFGSEFAIAKMLEIVIQIVSLCHCIGWINIKTFENKQNLVIIV